MEEDPNNIVIRWPTALQLVPERADPEMVRVQVKAEPEGSISLFILSPVQYWGNSIAMDP